MKKSGPVISNVTISPFKKTGSLKPLFLIVDDEEDICFLLENILKDQDIENESVHNLADAVNFLQSHEPSVIFLDNKLPDGFGFDHVRDFREKYPRMKIIMITAHDNYREQALKEGVDFFIPKPFSKKVILDAVNNFV